MDILDEVDNTYGVDQDTVRIHTNDEGVHVPESCQSAGVVLQQLQQEINPLDNYAIEFYERALLIVRAHEL